LHSRDVSSVSNGQFWAVLACLTQPHGVSSGVSRALVHPVRELSNDRSIVSTLI